MNENYDYIKLQFGLAIKEIRVSRNLSQEKLAENSDLHRTYISDVERGDRNVSLINIIKIAEGLNISVSELFKEMEKGQ